MNTKQLADDAAALGLSVEIAHGKVKIEGCAGDVKKVFAAQGLDARAEGMTGWSMWEDGECIANISRMPNATDYAYGRTYAP